MLLQIIIFLLFGLQSSWAQQPVAPPELPPVPEMPAPPTPLEQPALPVPPELQPPMNALPPTAENDVLGDISESEVLTPTKRDPFAKPQSLLEKEIENVKPIIDPSIYIDMRIEPIRRFPLRNYVLVGIIFDVEYPKAMVKDPDGNMHLLTTNQRIGNQEGLITKIERGELVVEEKGKLISIKLLK